MRLQNGYTDYRSGGTFTSKSILFEFQNKSSIPSTLQTNSTEQSSMSKTIDLSALTSGGSEMF